MKHVDELCHPIQPLGDDGKGVTRFKANAIVQWLADQRPQCMNEIQMMPFSREDRVQFAQLIGYSHCGFGELSYVREEDYQAALLLDSVDPGRSDARVRALQKQLEDARNGMAAGLAALYERHPDDFKEPR